MMKLLKSRPFILLVIMLVAVFLRARLFLQIEHNIDHAYPVWQALTTLDRGVFPLVGQQTSVLFANPPLTGYLFLPLVALIRSALAPYVLVIPLNTLGVLLTYRALRRLIGTDGALIGAALMAVNPWVIEYSRTSWVQSLLPFLVPTLFYALVPVLLGIAKHPARRVMIAFAILTVLAHTYLLGYIMLIPVGVLLVIFRKRIKWRAVAVGVLIFGLTAGLYGIGLLGQRDQTAARVENFASEPPRLSAEAWTHAVRLVTGADYELARGTQAPIQDSASRHELSLISHYVLYAALLIGLVIAAYSVIRRRDERMMILLIWFGVPIVLMSYVGQVIHPFYQLFGIPAGYGLVGLTVVSVIRFADEKLKTQRKDAKAQRRNVGWLSLIVAVLLAAHSVLMAINSSRYYEETARIPGAHGLTALSLEWGMRLGDNIRELLPPNGTVYSDLDAPYILSSFAGQVLDYVSYPPYAQVNSYVQIFPVNGGVKVYSFTPESEVSSYRFGDVGRRRILLPDAVSVAIEYVEDSEFAVHLLPTINIASVMGDSPTDQGLLLFGYNLHRNPDEDNYFFWTVWRVLEHTQEIERRDFQLFVHFFDSQGNRIAVLDMQAIPTSLWRVGDIHVYWMEIPVQFDAISPTEIGFGLYDPNAQINAIFVTPEGEYTPIIMLPEQWTP